MQIITTRARYLIQIDLPICLLLITPGCAVSQQANVAF